MTDDYWRGPVPREYLDALAEIGKHADQFKADEITALRFTVLVGSILGRLAALPVTR